MTDRYAVINPETLMAMRRAGHVAKLEARIEKLEAALREIAAPDWDSESYPDEIARKALEGKDD
jgi:BMFP domain-containing protein YqiC